MAKAASTARSGRPRASPAAALLVALTGGLLLVAASAGCKLESRGPGAPVLKEQRAAPMFVLEDERGESVALDARLPHGPVVLYFYRGFW